ncbi:MAG: endonuclease domain-containing protein [Oceanicaulis sp.]|nr:endonuclease domain-containing protein [Oceanicaulis sp.]
MRPFTKLLALMSIQRARELRRRATPHEALFWSRVRTWRDAGLHVRRQVPMGPFIADFICHKARVVIDLDGSGHAEGAQPVRDRNRDAWFEAEGYLTFSIWNIQLDQALDATLDWVWEVLHERIRQRGFERESG